VPPAERFSRQCGPAPTDERNAGVNDDEVRHDHRLSSPIRRFAPGICLEARPDESQRGHHDPVVGLRAQLSRRRPLPLRDSGIGITAPAHTY
jgi:hypothetical protein